VSTSISSKLNRSYNPHSNLMYLVLLLLIIVVKTLDSL